MTLWQERKRTVIHGRAPYLVQLKQPVSEKECLDYVLFIKLTRRRHNNVDQYCGMAIGIAR